MDKLAQSRQLAQLAPANTAAQTIYEPPPGVRTEIDAIWICNTDSSGHAASVYNDADGTTYSTATALIYSLTIGANTTTILADNEGKTGIIVDGDEGGAIGVQTDSANNLTFTLYGRELSK